MMTAPLLLAAGLDWLEGILPLLFVLFWIVSQVRGLFRGAERAAPQGPGAPRPAARPPVDEEAHREVVRQIEEFIRRSAGERVAPEARPRPVAPPRPSRQQPQRSGARPGKRPPPEASGRDAAARRPEPAAFPTAVGAARGIGTLGGHEVDVARHVRDRFAHEIEHLPAGLGQVAPDQRPEAPLQAAPAAEIAALVRNPATLRQLWVVREILDRPADRW